MCMARSQSITSITSDEIDMATARTALQLKRRGYDLFTIAERLQMSEMASTEAIRKGIEMAQATIGFAERRELLAIEVDRLDTLQNAVWDQAMEGDVRSVEAALKIIAQRSRMLGLDQADTGASSTTVVVAGNTEAYVAALEQASQRELEA